MVMLSRKAMMRSGGGWTPTFLVREQFTTNEDPPLTSPRTCEPGPGSATIVDSGSNNKIAGSMLITSGYTAYYSEPRVVFDPQARARGRALMYTYKLYGTGVIGGWYANDSASTGSSRLIQFATSDSFIGCYAGGNVDIAESAPSNYDYTVAHILRSTAGGFLIAKGGQVFLDWTLLYVESTKTDDVLYPILTQYANGTIERDNVAVSDLPAPFDDDFGLATDRKGTSVPGDTLAHAADGIVEAVWTAVTDDNLELDVRRTDDGNRWVVRCDQAGSTVKLIERVGGVETERGSAAQTWTNGTAYRLTVIMRGNSILVFVNNSRKIKYDSASFNATAVVAKTNRALSDFVSWPRTLSDVAQDILNTLQSKIADGSYVPTDSLPVYRSDMTVFAGNPVLTAADVGTGGTTAADPLLYVINGQLYMFFEATTEEGVGQDWMATSEDGYTWGNFSQVSTNTDHYAHPVIYEENGTIHLYMQRGNGLVGYRSSPVEGFPNWTDETVVFDSVALGWHHMREFDIFRHSDGKYYLLAVTGDGSTEDQQIRGLWCDTLTNDWNTDGALVATGVLLDMDDVPFANKIVEIRRLIAGERFLLYFGATALAPTRKAIAVLEVTELTPTSFEAHWISDDITFGLSLDPSRWDSQLIHCASPCWYGGKWYFAYDANYDGEWMIGMATR